MSAETVIKQIESLSPDEKRKVRRFVLGDGDQGGGANGAAEGASRQPDLHPGSMEMSPDFNAPLSEDFWLGKE